MMVFVHFYKNVKNKYETLHRSNNFDLFIL
jgi:hypothetical protein